MTATATDYNAEQHAKGLDIGSKAEHVTIAVNGVWGAKMKDGSHIHSYEKIGYHAGTAALMDGFKASGVEIIDYREKDDYPKTSDDCSGELYCQCEGCEW